MPRSVDLSKQQMAQYRYLLQGLQSSSEKSKTFLCSFIFLCLPGIESPVLNVLTLPCMEMFLCALKKRGIYFPQDCQVK